ncbi:hypothetical protein [Marixanthomonas ophiurae]|uniref:Cell wall anchor protein n=1 Tax=Marixanthomonas ophiurae TaxID=387659 RepID=A0A3E1QBR3_9FLAO|nr:hypothetical protein [Marixanthomonas ophiurae]RFN59563.1 hypothetical protein DZ858_05745 [Marixanthomonas ophiurae]
MKSIKLLLLSLLFTGFSYAQVGIGTTDPHSSSMLEIDSDSQGLLIPRMTSGERDAIVDPANSLLVFDTDENTYYYNEGDSTTPNWVPFFSDNEKRDNYVLVKSVADFPGVTSGTITLDENTYYEINGTIDLTAPIDLNNAYVSGLDANEDVLSAPGVVFQGNTGGAIRNVTLEGTTAFSLNGPGISTNSTLLIQNTIVDGMSGSVGSISNFGVYFSNIVQFVNNSNGITYSNIGNLLLNNQAWFGNNTGTYETFTNNFGLIEKVSGLSAVSSGNTGIDVSSNPSVGAGIIQGTVFSGAGTDVNGYPMANTYPGYNFSVNWEVNAPGIPRESDDNASGNFYITRNSTTSNTVFSIATPTPINASIDPGQMFRFSNSTPTVTGSNNVLEYEGKETRTFSIRGNLSYKPSPLPTTGVATVHVFYIRRYSSGGNPIEVPLGTEVYEEVGAQGVDDLVRAIPLSGKVTLDPGDYVRIFGQRISASGTGRSNIQIYSVSLTLD